MKIKLSIIAVIAIISHLCSCSDSEEKKQKINNLKN